MNTALLPKKAAEFLGFAALILIAYALLRQFGLYRWTVLEAGGITVLVQLVGGIYAVLLAFTVFVIWTQFTEVENCVVREADSLAELLRYSSFLHDDARASIRRGIAHYVRQIVEQEWVELGEGRKAQQSAEAFARMVATVVATTPQDVEEPFLRGQVFEVWRTVSLNREDRVAKSLTRMPPTLSGLVKLIAGVLLLLICVYPFHYSAAGSACLFLASLVLFLANFVMTDTDNPLKGVWNVRLDAFSELPR